jgi:hypothetical protein
MRLRGFNCLAVFSAAMWIFSLACLWADETPRYYRVEDISLSSPYPWKKNIVTTCFWVGEGASGYNSMTNYKSAWDGSWTKSFGGMDCPEKRIATAGFGKTTFPKTFVPTQNPYYVALPYNDIKYPKTSRKLIPWWSDKAYKEDPYKSQCKGRWVMIVHEDKVCFAQWEDVGPFRYDHAGYVFGGDRPNTYSKAGLDVSPAVRDYLGMEGLEKADWRFVNDEEVPYGPWIEYSEQAIIFSLIKAEAKAIN